MMYPASSRWYKGKFIQSTELHSGEATKLLAMYLVPAYDKTPGVDVEAKKSPE